MPDRDPRFPLGDLDSWDEDTLAAQKSMLTVNSLYTKPRSLRRKEKTTASLVFLHPNSKDGPLFCTGPSLSHRYLSDPAKIRSRWNGRYSVGQNPAR